MSILVLAEHDNSAIKPSTLVAIGAAKELSGDIHVLVSGANCGPPPPILTVCPKF
jgi:electron transfer flavoprotein alpha subunit